MNINLFYVVVFVLILGAIFLSDRFMKNRTENYGTEALLQDVQNDQVSKVVIRQNNEVPTGRVIVKLKNDKTKMYAVSDVNTVVKALDKVAPDIYSVTDVEGQSIIITLIPYIFAIILFVLVMMFLSAQIGGAGGGSGSKMMNFGKSRAKMNDETNVRFENVAGLEEEKEELEEIVDFLKAPGKYNKLGARIPKGVILVGPRGAW